MKSLILDVDSCGSYCCPNSNFSNLIFSNFKSYLIFRLIVLNSLVFGFLKLTVVKLQIVWQSKFLKFNLIYTIIGTILKLHKNNSDD